MILPVNIVSITPGIDLKDDGSGYNADDIESLVSQALIEANVSIDLDLLYERKSEDFDAEFKRAYKVLDQAKPTLPPSSSETAGQVIIFQNFGQDDVIVTCNGDDQVPDNVTNALGANHTLVPWASLSFLDCGDGTWMVF